MEYRVILVKNGKLKKTFHVSNSKLDAFTDYRELISENEHVLFEKRFINYNGIKPVKHILYAVKTPEERDSKRFIKDKFGKLVEEDLLFGVWRVLDSIEYRIEEKFWIYGNDSKNNRKSIREVIKVLMKGIGPNKNNKQVIVVHNKLVIYNETEFDMILCKCIEDCQRLHHLLYKTAKESKIKGLLFMGTATSPANISLLYDIIHEETGWSYIKIRRTTTRP